MMKVLRIRGRSGISSGGGGEFSKKIENVDLFLGRPNHHKETISTNFSAPQAIF